MQQRSTGSRAGNDLTAYGSGVTVGAGGSGAPSSSVLSLTASDPFDSATVSYLRYAAAGGWPAGFPDASADFSLSFWARHPGTPGRAPTVWSMGDSNACMIAHWIATDIHGAYFKLTSEIDYNYEYPDDEFFPNVWHHVVFSYFL